MGHADAWPAGDLALQEAVRVALGLKTRPTVKEMAVIADAWRPHRGAAAHLFWAYYRVTKRPGFNALPPDADTKPATNGAKTAKTRPRERTAAKKATVAKASVKRRKDDTRHDRRT
jgi:DNA-3-methyladenine glycosylase II